MSRTPTVAQLEPVGGHGGMHYYDLGLAQGLVAAGVRVLLYTSSLGDLTAWPRDGFAASTPFAGSYGEGPRWRRGLAFARGLRRALGAARGQRADLVHLHFFGAGATETLSLALARRSGLPVVITVHDVASLAAADPGSGSRRLYARADALVVHNESSRRELAPLAPTTPIEIVPHGHYLHVAERLERGAARRRLGLDAAAPTALFFGQIKRSKGLDLLLEAMRGVVAGLPGARLLIAGRTWRDDPRVYREAIGAAGLAASVDWRDGFVDEADVPLLFAAADLVVLPYRRVYQSGVLLMAMSYGRGVLTSDLPAMREVVRDGVNGFTFRAGDAGHLTARLLELLTRPWRVEAAATAALATVATEHDWGLVGERTAALYRRLLPPAG